MKPAKNVNSVKFVSSRCSLPLFIASRNQIKSSKLDELKKYIKKKNVLYNKYIDNEFENTTLQHLRHIAGADGLHSMTKKCNLYIRKKRSSNLNMKTWQLPPNLYDVNQIPFEVKRGIGGAHWPKKHTHQAKHRPNTQLPHVDFYNFPKMNELLFAPCNRKKGIFFTGTREHATTRCMVSSIATCYKNPSDPGPSTYSPTYIKKLTQKRFDTPNPHLFYFSSCVPLKKNIIHNPHTSFTGAPGRYETRYPKSCPCSSKMMYYPQLDLHIDKEKRNKFRRLPYEITTARHYASPDWRHVKGRGFRYLFFGAKRPQSKLLTETEAKRQKSLKLYPDSKYIEMINNPSRAPLSFRMSSVSSLGPRIKFNCMPKIITRRQLKSNKKTAFNSSQERFRDAFRLPILSVKQQENIKLTLPLERQFRDHPIMDKRISEINSKLNEIPKHMLPIYMPSLRKQAFKFQPLPKAKVLLTEDETSAKEVHKEGCYLSSLEAKKFFKQNSKN